MLYRRGYRRNKMLRRYGNSEGEIFQKKIFATTNVKENLQEVKESIHGFGTAQAIGVSCGGPLDSQKGQILSPPNLPWVGPDSDCGSIERRIWNSCFSEE